MTQHVEQPMPVATSGAHIHDLVRDDLAKFFTHPCAPVVATHLTGRKEIGVERYGQPLQAHNGRDALRDAYEEALDLCVYLKQALEEGLNVSSAYLDALRIACRLAATLSERGPQPT